MSVSCLSNSRTCQLLAHAGMPAKTDTPGSLFCWGGDLFISTARVLTNPIKELRKERVLWSTSPPRVKSPMLWSERVHFLGRVSALAFTDNPWSRQGSREARVGVGGGDADVRVHTY